MLIQLTWGRVPRCTSATKSFGKVGTNAFWYSAEEGSWYWEKKGRVPSMVMPTFSMVAMV